MRIEQLQDNLKASIEHFVNLGKVLNLSYSKLWPSEQGTLMYSLLMAARRLSKEIAQIHKLQELFIPDVTGLELIEVRGELLSLMSYLEQGDCDLDIAYKYNENTNPIYDPDEIVLEENIDYLFPAREQGKDYVTARKLMIGTSTKNYAELIECLGGVVEIIDSLLKDAKNLKRNEDIRNKRYGAMENYYMRNCWEQDREQLIARVKGELLDEDNKGKDEIQILQVLLQDIYADYIEGNTNKIMANINMFRNDKEEVSRLLAEERGKISYDDVLLHFRFRESDKLISNHMASRALLEPCQEYQGKLFTNKAAFEFAKLIKEAVALYVGFDSKMNAAFLFYAMRDLGLVYVEENNATLMSDFMRDVYNVEISADTITKPLRKTDGQAFCMIDENNLRSFSGREFARYKEPYWLCYSIINKELDIKEVSCADYLKTLHPTIAAKDVFEKLEEDDRKRLYFLSSVLRGETLMF